MKPLLFKLGSIISIESDPRDYSINFKSNVQTEEVFENGLRINFTLDDGGIFYAAWTNVSLSKDLSYADITEARDLQIGNTIFPCIKEEVKKFKILGLNHSSEYNFWYFAESFHGLNRTPVTSMKFRTLNSTGIMNNSKKIGFSTSILLVLLIFLIK